jgi:hypothetical protein
MILHICAILVTLGAWIHAADLLPMAPTAVVEMHGTYHGERFWAKLRLPEANFANNRMLELVYTPPAPAAVAGAHLIDCPFLLLDDRLRLVAWNGRDTLQRAVATATGYRVTRELERAVDLGKDVAPDSDERNIPMALGWDERLAPILLAFAWHAGANGAIPIADFFGVSTTASTASWTDATVVIAGRPHRALPDAAGRLARLDDAAGNAVLTIAAWITP